MYNIFELKWKSCADQKYNSLLKTNVTDSCLEVGVAA